jgi:hypothetical protein
VFSYARRDEEGLVRPLIPVEAMPLGVARHKCTYESDKLDTATTNPPLNCTSPTHCRGQNGGSGACAGFPQEDSLMASECRVMKYTRHLP